MMPTKIEYTPEYVKTEIEAGTNWENFAECPVAPELFSPPSHFERKPEKDFRETAAKAICRRCLVREECLESALDDQDGDSNIHGGLNALEIKRLKRQLRR